MGWVSSLLDDCTVITVPLAFAPDAAYEAIDAGIKEIIIITEGIPRKDAAAIVEYAELHGARMIGPNCLGIIVPDVCRFGSLGGPAVDCRKAFGPGVVDMCATCVQSFESSGPGGTVHERTLDLDLLMLRHAWSCVSPCSPCWPASAAGT